FNIVGVTDNALIIGQMVGHVNPDCTTPGKTFVRVSRSPSHGVITMHEGVGFAYFAKQPECNSRKVLGVTVEYVPARGYTGPDEVGLDIISQVGYESLVTYSITIK